MKKTNREIRDEIEYECWSCQDDNIVAVANLNGFCGVCPECLARTTYEGGEIEFMLCPPGEAIAELERNKVVINNCIRILENLNKRKIDIVLQEDE